MRWMYFLPGVSSLLFARILTVQEHAGSVPANAAVVWERSAAALTSTAENYLASYYLVYLLCTSAVKKLLAEQMLHGGL
jgi:hypothetical protein